MSEATGNTGSLGCLFVECILKSTRVNVGGGCEQVPPEISQTWGLDCSSRPQDLVTYGKQGRMSPHTIWPSNGLIYISPMMTPEDAQSEVY